MTVVYVLGAPGSGKTTVTGPLRSRLPDVVVLDWDAFMNPAGQLAGSPIRSTPSTWSAYERLVRSVVDELTGHPVLLLGVVTPDQLSGWPDGRWILLDCDDEERRRRLYGRDPAEVDDAIRDAAEYRALALAAIDTTGLDPAEIARRVAELVRAG